MWRPYALFWCKEVRDCEGGDKMRVNIELNKSKPPNDALQFHVPLLYIQSIWARSFQWRTEDLVSPLSSNLLSQWNKREIRHVDETMEQFPPDKLEHNSLDHCRGTNHQNISRLAPHSIKKKLRKKRKNKPYIIINFLMLAWIQVFWRGGSMAPSPGKFWNFKSSETRFPPFWGKVSVFQYLNF